jgi:hypothetical protein
MWTRTPRKTYEVKMAQQFTYFPGHDDKDVNDNGKLCQNYDKEVISYISLLSKYVKLTDLLVNKIVDKIY